MPKRLKAIENLFDKPPLGKATPYWYMRLDLIKKRIEASGWTWFDRKKIMILFDVSQATAVRILNRFHAEAIGKAKVLHRDKLLHTVSQILLDPKYQSQREDDEERWARISAMHNPARIVRYEEVPVEPKANNLPPGIILTRSYCHIKAKSRAELMEKLSDLALYATQGGIEELRTLYQEEDPTEIVVYQ